MFSLITVEAALDAWNKLHDMPTLEVGGGMRVYGSDRALTRAQMYILADSKHPVERRDVNRYLANELKLLEAEAKALRAENIRLRALLRPFANIPIPQQAKLHWPINYNAVSCTFKDVAAARAEIYPTETVDGEES